MAGGVVSTFGAGLFAGLAPAASLAGSWLLVAFVLAAVLGLLTVLSTSERPLDTVRAPVRRLVFGVGVLGRLAAAVAVAGTFGQYVTGSRQVLGALGLVVVVTAVVVVGRRTPVLVVRAGAVVVLGCLALVVLACFAIEPVAPAVAVDGGGSVLGLVAAAGLLTVCFLGVGPLPRGARVVEVQLPADDAWVAEPREGGPDVGGVRDELPAADAWISGPREGRPDLRGEPVGGARDDSPLEFGVGRAALRAWRLGVLAVLAVVLVGCLAVGSAVLRQLGAPRLALSPAPLLDALAAADASALEPLVVVGVAVGTGFVLLGILRGLAAAGGSVPPVRVSIAAGTVVALGASLVEPADALAVAAVLLLGDVVLRLVAVRRRLLE
jgi:basic amino acid/polyamine antiporter, APA family